MLTNYIIVHIRHFLTFLFYLLVLANTAQAKLLDKINPAPDNNYIQTLTDKFALRLYTSNKFTGYKLGQFSNNQHIVYRPNSNINVGFGGTYRFLTINIGFPAPFINNDRSNYGKTKFLDLQTYVYMRKLTVNLYAQLYKGYYLANENVLNVGLPTDSYMQRPDIKTKNIGSTVEYIFNNRRFSYRAAYLQNEWQKKSAGSFLAGGSVHYLNMQADSSVIPTNLSATDFFDGYHFNKSHLLNLTANAGYAHTFVIAQHFFIMGELLAGVGANYTMLADTKAASEHSGLGLNLSGTFRVAAGYNSERYFIGLHCVDYITHNTAPILGSWQQYETGNLRFSVVKRFTIRKPLPKPLNRVFNSNLPPITN